MKILTPLSLIMLLFMSSCENTEVTLTMNNNSSDTCTEIYIRESGDTNWGDNRISENLEPGDDYSTGLDKETYDFLIKFLASEDSEYLEVDISMYDNYDFNIVD